VSEPVLFLGGTHTQQDQAARRTFSNVAKLSFAFTIVDLYAVIRLSPVTYYTPVDPISPPSEIHRLILRDERFRSLRLGSVSMVEAAGTAPASSMPFDFLHR